MTSAANQGQIKVTTKLKFTTSETTGAIVSFASTNPKTGQLRGVRQTDPYPKKICLVDKQLAPYILFNVLYDCVLVPMTEKDGYVVISATPVEFTATIETTYVPKALYTVDVKFGNKTIQFDPKDGRKESVRNFSACKRILETRIDIKNLPQVVEDFENAARDLINRYEQDGFIYKW